MLYYSAVFLVIALIAAVFGFGGIATQADGLARLAFAVFLAGFVVTLIVGLLRLERRR